MINVQLLKETWEYLRVHPENWDQSRWAYMSADGSRTTYCFGAAALKVLDYNMDWERQEDDSLLISPLRAPTAQTLSPYEVAKKVLGLSEGQAFHLFFGPPEWTPDAVNILEHLATMEEE